MEPISLHEVARVTAFHVVGHSPEPWQVAMLERFARDHAAEANARSLLLGVILGATIPFVVWFLIVGGVHP